MTQNAPVTLHAIVDRIKTQKTILLPAFAISAFAQTAADCSSALDTLKATRFHTA